MKYGALAVGAVALGARAAMGRGWDIVDFQGPALTDMKRLVRRKDITGPAHRYVVRNIGGKVLESGNSLSRLQKAYGPNLPVLHVDTLGRRGSRARWERASDDEVLAMEILQTQTYLHSVDVETIRELLAKNLIKRIRRGSGSPPVCPPGCVPNPRNPPESLDYPQFKLTHKGAQYLKMMAVP